MIRWLYAATGPGARGACNDCYAHYDAHSNTHRKTIMRVSDSPRPYLMPDSPPQRKQRLNLTVDAALVDAARSRGFNLSAMMEEKIQDSLKAEEKQKLRDGIKAYAKEYNEHFEKHGLWSDGMRLF
jgi:antitoxin CcdA